MIGILQYSADELNPIFRKGSEHLGARGEGFDKEGIV